MWSPIRKSYEIIKQKERIYYLKKFSKQLATLDAPFAKEIHQAIQASINSIPDVVKAKYAQIENMRRMLSKDTSILVQSDLGEAAIYDKGLTVAQANSASKPKAAATFLGLLSHYINPQNILELGTNVGISSAYLAKSTTGEVTTLDASVHRQFQAKKIHKELEINTVQYVQGLFVDTLAGVLESNKNWDFIFIDGHHQYQPTLDYFDQIFKKSTKPAIVVFDDVKWSLDMQRAWNELKVDSRFLYTVDLYTIGIAVVNGKENNKPFNIKLYKNEVYKLF